MGLVKLLRENEDGISNFCFLTMLITNLKILAKILADRLQTALPSLIDTVKGMTIQNSLHLVHTIIEKVSGNAALINLDQSKAFDRVDHGFLKAVLSVTRFKLHSRSWIRFLYAHPHPVVVVEGSKYEALHFVSIDSSRLPVLTHTLHPCAGTVPAQIEGRTRSYVASHYLAPPLSQHACNEECRGGWGDQRNRKVRSRDRSQN